MWQEKAEAEAVILFFAKASTESKIAATVSIGVISRQEDWPSMIAAWSTRRRLAGDLAPLLVEITDEIDGLLFGPDGC